jgi:hypothetical protein
LISDCSCGEHNQSIKQLKLSQMFLSRVTKKNLLATTPLFGLFIVYKKPGELHIIITELVFS